MVKALTTSSTLLAVSGIIYQSIIVSQCFGAVNDSILEQLRAADATALSKLTLSFDRELPAHEFLTDQGTITYRCTLMKEGDTWALECNALSKPEAIYRPPGTPGYKEIDYEEGNLVVWRLDSFKTLSDKTINETNYNHELVIVDPSNKVVHKGQSKLRSVYNPEDLQSRFQMEEIIWGTGYGFASNLEKVLDQRVEADGLLYLRAKGTYKGQGVGIWEMIIDPQNGFIVRSAQFTYDGQRLPSMSCRTNGLKAHDGVASAETGVLELAIEGSKPRETKLYLHKYEPRTDGELISRIREDLKHTMSDPKAELLDYRGATGPKRTRNIPARNP
jgi:hypothetical protein